ELETECLMRHRIACVMHEDHELASRDSVNVRELAQHCLITYWSRGMLRSNIDRALREAGVAPRSTVQVNLALTALALAQRKAGIALIDPHMLTVTPLPGVVARPLVPAIGINAI